MDTDKSFTNERLQNKLPAYFDQITQTKKSEKNND